MEHSATACKMVGTILAFSHLSGVLALHQSSVRMDSPVSFRRVRLRQVPVARPLRVARAGGSAAVDLAVAALRAAVAADSAVVAEAAPEAREETGPGGKGRSSANARK